MSQMSTQQLQDQEQLDRTRPAVANPYLAQKQAYLARTDATGLAKQHGALIASGVSYNDPQLRIIRDKIADAHLTQQAIGTPSPNMGVLPPTPAIAAKVDNYSQLQQAGSAAMAARNEEMERAKDLASAPARVAVAGAGAEVAGSNAATAKSGYEQARAASMTGQVPSEASARQAMLDAERLGEVIKGVQAQSAARLVPQQEAATGAKLGLETATNKAESQRVPSKVAAEQAEDAAKAAASTYAAKRATAESEPENFKAKTEADRARMAAETATAKAQAAKSAQEQGITEFQTKSMVGGGKDGDPQGGYMREQARAQMAEAEGIAKDKIRKAAVSNSNTSPEEILRDAEPLLGRISSRIPRGGAVRMQLSGNISQDIQQDVLPFQSLVVDKLKRYAQYDKAGAADAAARVLARFPAPDDTGDYHGFIGSGSGHKQYAQIISQIHTDLLNLAAGR